MKDALDRLGDPRAGQILLATDFDGTLAPIVSHPALAEALPANLVLMERLIELGVHVAVISGRAQSDLHKQVPIDGARLLGENGLGTPTGIERKALDRFNGKAGRLVAPMPGVWLELKPGSTSVHFRGSPDAGPDVLAGILPLASRYGLVATFGRMVVEVRPQRADKASAVSTLIGALQPKAIIYAGDDEPDHDVFRLLRDTPRRHVTVGISSLERPIDRFAICDLVLEGPYGMSTLLRGLLERVARRQDG